ncbi:MAG: putative molybdenum carrier protein [bacterium]
MAVKKIVTGGQTGVDRAALDAAEGLGLERGGWCPAGRRAQDGEIPEGYPLEETPSREYEQRTEWNVRDSDATLILNRGPLDGGTLYTVNIAREMGRPHLIVQLEEMDGEERERAGQARVRRWLEDEEVEVLNVAGPREQKRPGIYEEAAALLRVLFAPPER